MPQPENDENGESCREKGEIKREDTPEKTSGELVDTAERKRRTCIELRRRR